MKPSRLDVRHLRYAIAVADSGGFRRAAEILNVAQPAISKSVKDAETDLGFPIFERSGTGVTVTDAGRTFLEDARLAVASSNAPSGPRAATPKARAVTSLSGTRRLRPRRRSRKGLMRSMRRPRACRSKCMSCPPIQC
ncbi:LysR family transcriptional regulator [uncultured Jannaschia sp.]|uniref:LysR family transcriptional regulator n=1 Tax=uncultured Jannaschia sp. TaxID=293347 RepID=UPI00345B63BD